MNEGALATSWDKVPVQHGRWFRRLLGFVGPAYLISVGYMDPGNWATDIEGGARFGYALIWVLLLSNLMAVLLQTLSARLGIVTGHDLAEGCRREYPRPIAYTLWLLAEVAVAATDLAEALGTIVGLNLLFHIPLLWGCVITAMDTLLLIGLQRFGMRKLEALIITLVATIGACFLIEVVLARPSWSGVAGGFVPSLDASSLYIAIGIIGATVMPHNLYLHSSLVQSRAVSNTITGKRDACRFNLADSAIALNAAFFVNAAILITAAANFHTRGLVVTELGQAHELLDNLLGSAIAPAAFAVALVAAGQSSTITGTIAGQIVMEGFLHLRITPWVRRLVTRLIALAPAVLVIVAAGEQGIYRLLILSQVVLSLQLPFAVVPLIHFTSDRRKMGTFASGRLVTTLAWAVAALLAGLNGWLVVDEMRGWPAGALWAGVPTVILLAGVLAYLVLRPLLWPGPAWEMGIATVSRQVAARLHPPSFRHIGVALQHAASDSNILATAIGLARSSGARLYLIHVVDSPGVMLLGERSGSRHASADQAYVEELAREVEEQDLAAEPVLGFGRPQDEIVRLARQIPLDLLVIGSHGHRGLEDLVRGETIAAVRHRLEIPIMVVRAPDSEPATGAARQEREAP